MGLMDIDRSSGFNRCPPFVQQFSNIHFAPWGHSPHYKPHANSSVWFVGFLHPPAVGQEGENV
jgi:hypothetical protein